MKSSSVSEGDLAGEGRGGGDRVRALLASGRPLALGGCYDGLSAAVLENAGFPALFLSGAGVAASAVGLPDLGLVTMDELVSVARRVVAQSRVPVFVDADTGFGNELNVTRTVRELVDAGVAGIMLEDQVAPKRCGHLAGKSVVDRETFIRRIAAASIARGDSDVLIIARTDALAVEGIDEALARMRDAVAYGADITFVEAPTTVAEIRRIGQESAGVPIFALAGGKVPSLSVPELHELGFPLVSYPGVAMMPMISEVTRAAQAVLASGTHVPLDGYRMVPRDIFEAVGLNDWLELEAQLGGDLERLRQLATSRTASAAEAAGEHAGGDLPR